MVIGLDGTPGGWVAIAIDDGGGHFVGDFVIKGIETDFAAVSEADVIAVDIPIGFGPRQADRLTRKYLGPERGRSVFTVPEKKVVVTALMQPAFREGLGVNSQLYRIAPRIVHVTGLAESRKRIAGKLREVHPEVSFQVMNENDPLRYGKKTYGGVHERLRLLADHGIRLDGLNEETRRVPIDDVLDAAAAAWSALRIKSGIARPFPDPPEQQERLSVAIWA
jgi:predicted RNase H-like nuclease